jgi:hypothetical protein
MVVGSDAATQPTENRCLRSNRAHSQTLSGVTSGAREGVVTVAGGGAYEWPTLARGCTREVIVHAEADQHCGQVQRHVRLHAVRRRRAHRTVTQQRALFVSWEWSFSRCCRKACHGSKP